MENNTTITIPYTFTTRKGSTVIVRYATDGDLDEALRFINELIAEDTYITMHGNPLSREQEKEWLEKILKDQDEKRGVFLFVFKNEQLIGNCSILRSGPRMEHVGVVGITISKEFRHEGIGKELFTLMFSEAKKLGFTHLELKVYGENAIAQDLYKKMGFAEIGRFKKIVQYKDRLIDDIWMAKEL